jgi:hypothetical protein
MCFNGRIDVLINNTGYVGVDTLEEVGQVFSLFGMRERTDEKGCVGMKGCSICSILWSSELKY